MHCPSGVRYVAEAISASGPDFSNTLAVDGLWDAEAVIRADRVSLDETAVAAGHATRAA